jgi:presenilin-like A22 family membrane protease
MYSVLWPGTPPFLFLFLKLHAKERWMFSLYFSTIVVFVVYAVFINFLQIPLHQGIIL